MFNPQKTFRCKKKKIKNFSCDSDVKMLWIYDGWVPAITICEVYGKCKPIPKIKEIGVGGATCSGTTLHQIYANETAVDGATCSGTTLHHIRANKMAVDGVACDGESLHQIRANETATGGLVCGGSAVLNLLPVVFTITAVNWSGDGWGIGYINDTFDPFPSGAVGGTIDPDPLILTEDYRVRRVSDQEHGGAFTFIIDNYQIAPTPPSDALIHSIQVVGDEINKTYYANDPNIFYSHAYNAGHYTVWSWPDAAGLQIGPEYTITVNFS